MTQDYIDGYVACIGDILNDLNLQGRKGVIEVSYNDLLHNLQELYHLRTGQRPVFVCNKLVSARVSQHEYEDIFYERS